MSAGTNEWHQCSGMMCNDPTHDRVHLLVLKAIGYSIGRVSSEELDVVEEQVRALIAKDTDPEGFDFTWAHHEAVSLATCTEAARLNPKLLAALEEVRDRIAALLPPRYVAYVGASIAPQENEDA